MYVHDGIRRYWLASVTPLRKGRLGALRAAEYGTSPSAPSAERSTAKALALAALEANNIPMLLQLLPRVAAEEGLTEDAS